MIVSTVVLEIGYTEKVRGVFQIELIKNFRGWRDSFSMPQVIGNIKKTIIT